MIIKIHHCLKLVAGLALAIVFVALLTFKNERIHACSCDVWPPERAFEAASLVFYGDVVDKKSVESDWTDWSDHHSLVQFKAQYVWKGPITETIFINTLPDSSACGGWPWFEVGQEYFVYAYESPDAQYSPQVWLCSRIRRSGEADEDFEALGQGTTPEPGTSAPTPTPIPAPAPTPVPNPGSFYGNCNTPVGSTRAPINVLPPLFVVGVVLSGLLKIRRS